MVGEVIHVEREAAVVVEPYELADVLGISRLPVRRHPHHLVLALIDFESEERREHAVQQAQGVWKADLTEQLDVPVTSDSNGCGGPLADPVHGQDRRLAVGRAVEGAGRVREVVAAEEDPLRRNPEVLADQPFDPELLREPLDHRLAEDPEGSRIGRQRRHQDAVELDERLLVEDDPVEILAPELAGPEAELDRVDRKARVVLDPREAFLLSGSDDDAVLNECGGGVVEEARDAENVHALPLKIAASSN